MSYAFSREDYQRRTAWYTQARFGMFLPWGLYGPDPALPDGMDTGLEVQYAG